MTLDEFFVTFMKRFFDTMVLSTEKQKSGKEEQFYSAKSQYTFDRPGLKEGENSKKTL